MWQYMVVAGSTFRMVALCLQLALARSGAMSQFGYSMCLHVIACSVQSNPRQICRSTWIAKQDKYTLRH